MPAALPGAGCARCRRSLLVLALPEKFFPENLFAQVLWPLVLREQRRQELDCHAR